MLAATRWLAELLVAAAATSILYWALQQLTPYVPLLLIHGLAFLGFPILFLYAVLAAALVLLPSLVLTGLWLRRSATMPSDAPPLAQALWPALLSLITFLLLNALLAVLLRLVVSATALSQVLEGWKPSVQQVLHFGQTLTVAALVLDLLNLALLSAFLPALLRRLTGAASSALSYASFGRWLRALLICVLVGAIATLVSDLLPPSLRPERSTGWLLLFAHSLIACSAIPATALALYRLLRRSPEPTAVAAT